MRAVRLNNLRGGAIHLGSGERERGRGIRAVGLPNDTDAYAVRSYQCVLCTSKFWRGKNLETQTFDVQSKIARMPVLLSKEPHCGNVCLLLNVTNAWYSHAY